MILKLNNQKFDFFDGFELTLKFDSVASTFGFKLYFDPDNAQHKALVRPGAFPSAQVIHNDEVLITGVIISQSFTSSATPKHLVGISGYSRTGVLEDCHIPPDLHPLQSDGLSLKAIADKILGSFNLTAEVSSSVSSIVNQEIETESANLNQTIKAYLSSLAEQRNVVLTHTPGGNLLFTRANTNQTAVVHIDGSIPGYKATLKFNGQAMHSSITAIKQADIDNDNAGQTTVQNPFVSAFRPKIVTQSSGDDITTETLAKTALAAELKNISVNIDIDRWDINDKLVKPGQLITVQDPELFLYNRTKLFINSVKYVGDSTKTTASLECVLPSVYDGSTPTNIFA